MSAHSCMSWYTSEPPVWCGGRGIAPTPDRRHCPRCPVEVPHFSITPRRTSTVPPPLLARQPVWGRTRCPFVEAVVFLSDPEVRCELDGPAATRVFTVDREPTEEDPGRSGILAALLRREGRGLDPNPRGTGRLIPKSLISARSAFVPLGTGQRGLVVEAR